MDAVFNPNPGPYRPVPMTGANAEEEVRKGIRSVRWAIAGQAALYLVLAGFVWFLVAGHGGAGDLVWPLVLVSVNAALTVALVGCAVRLGQRRGGVVKAILGLECAFAAVLLIGLIVAFTSSSSGTVGVPAVFVWGFLIQAVLRPLQKPELRVAFGLPVITARVKK
ncbi:hypothetical protein [Amycolatopsis sp. NPDC051903]|uniref:hypothetical protein n=1 Tax=Amycolatopsis sp. NPDC051903 TaxID=3363936 RepID=UPI0037892146